MQVDGYSLDAQRDKLRKYAAYEDMVVAGEYSDEGFSGKNIQGRQEFQRMLNDIQDCKDGVSYVLVFKLSRFGRNAADVLNSLQLMQDFGVNLICVEDGIDSSKDAGKLMISVLSAVAEIERENIRTQTMAGREQKAREGKWNGGFAPYGYKLESGNLVIAEDEVEVIRVIYDRYIHTNEGVAGVAKYLNRNGFVKKLRQNNTIPGFSRNFVQDVLDNPVYMGKIAYGRRRTEKRQGTRNEMHVVEQSEFPVYDGQHEAIISEEDWYLAQEKRKINSFKREKVNNPDHAHILSGILKCPCCGKSMYGNIAKAHSKDKKTRYYYYCKNTVTPTGHECSFRLNIEQTEINKFVAKVISAMVSNPRFIEAIQAKIGTAIDTEDMEKQIAVLQGQLKQAFGTKSRLERQMDTLDINDAHYDRKILDLQRRYDEQYDTIEEIEVQIGELQSQIRSIQQEKISGDNIYRLLLAFDEVYHSATEAEQKEFMKAFIERIEMFPEKRKDGSWIKKIVFNFPVPVDGEEVKELPLETETTVDLCAAPGGKSTQIAGRMGGSGLLVSNEINPKRAKVLSRNVERLGIANAVVTNETPAALAQRLPEFFHRVMVDAPCSGEGMFRKEEAAVTDWSPETVQMCARRQAEILDCAARLLRPGGHLVYSTCTFAPEEDEEAVTAFLARHPDFALEPVEAPWFRESAPGMYRLWPHRLLGEGHFAAVLRKMGCDDAPAAVFPGAPLPESVRRFLKELGIRLPPGQPVTFGQTLYWMPPEMPPLHRLKVLRAGLELGTVKKDRFEPSHALALWLSGCARTLSLPPDGPQMAAYLHGEALPCAEKGWLLVTAGAYPIGWGKGDGSLLKNHYPKGLRK